MGFSLGDYHDLFMQEAEEYVENLNNRLLDLDKDREDKENITEIFRIAHSIKGSAAFVGLNELSTLAHRMENLLQLIRDGKMEVTDEVMDILFECFDHIKLVIDQVSNGEEPTRDFSETIAKIDAIVQGGETAISSDKAKAEEGKTDEARGEIRLSSEDKNKILEPIEKGRKAYYVEVFFEKDVKMKWIRAELIFRNVENKGEIVSSEPPYENIEKAKFENLRMVVISDEGKDTIKKACDVDQVERIEVKEFTKDDIEEKAKEGTPPTKKEMTEKEVKEREEKIKKAQSTVDLHSASKYVKVPVERLDVLMNNVGELVIANSGLLQIYEELKLIYGNKGIALELKNRIEQMARIARELQEGIMKTRMVPIGQIFSRFVRMVRDLSRAFKKEIELVMKGEETELDKKVIDAIGEPLMHLIRNAIDHGIEAPDERERLGKPKRGVIELNAYQSGNNIFIEIRDDGRGLDLEKIKSAAIKRGFATADELNKMSKADIYNFIFKPGFSTKEVVTDISGRGIGMNIVEEVVSRLNGSIRIQTKKGLGTSITLIFPLTLAIVTAIMVKIRDEIYAVPLSDVVETLKITPKDIITIEGYEVIYLRDKIVSLIRLDRALEFPEDEEYEKSREKYSVVVVNYGDKKVGLLADGLAGKQEIVIKSLDANYKTIPGLSGASILGDGSIILIIDVQKLISMSLEREAELSAEALSQKQIIDAEAVLEEAPKVVKEEVVAIGAGTESEKKKLLRI